MKIYADTKVYVQCVGRIATGGPELLHQFASYLISRGVETYMVYTGIDTEKEDPVCECYKHYHIPYADAVENEKRNILIVSEARTDLLYMEGLTVRKVIWWLSVDNFFSILKYRYSETYNRPLELKYIRYFSFESEMEVEHWAQSEYARKFLIFNGIAEDKIRMVTDYLNLIFLDDLVAKRNDEKGLNERENIVLYNPKKGIEFTKKLIDRAHDIKWIPIRNMTRKEVSELMTRAKVYIDFGNHPGKDRMPREAAVSGAVVITGRRGSAGNDIDVPIPSSYKFDDRDEAIPGILEKIRFVFGNYEKCAEHFRYYVDSIFREPVRFRSEVDQALDFSDIKWIPGICLFDVSYENILKLEVEMSKEDGLRIEYAVVEGLNRKNTEVGERELCFTDIGYARQLYLEGRINKFICSQSIKDNQGYFGNLIRKMGIDDEDWDIVNVK